MILLYKILIYKLLLASGGIEPESRVRGSRFNTKRFKSINSKLKAGTVNLSIEFINDLRGLNHLSRYCISQNAGCPEVEAMRVNAATRPINSREPPETPIDDQ